MMIPNIWENKIVPNHQPDNYVVWCLLCFVQGKNLPSTSIYHLSMRQQKTSQALLTAFGDAHTALLRQQTEPETQHGEHHLSESLSLF